MQHFRLAKLSVTPECRFEADTRWNEDIADAFQCLHSAHSLAVHRHLCPMCKACTA